MKIKRKVFDKLISQLYKPYVSILIGARQVGKSFLLREVMEYCQLESLQSVFYDLEDPDDLKLFAGNEKDIIDLITKNNVDVVFIDEFQYIKNATKVFKTIIDKQLKIKIYASGSSSVDIHKHLKESLAGRFRITEIASLSIVELKQVPHYNPLDYFKYGGMPGLLHEATLEEKIELLKNILQTYLLKDIKSLIREENIRSFNNLLYLLAQNQGSITSLTGFSNEVGLSIPAVSHHLEIMRQTYTCYHLESFSRNLANELKKSKKYYLYDIGMRNMILKDFSDISIRKDNGILLESFVFMTLQRKLKPNMEIKFWRTKQGDEVDFILLKDRKPYPFEVKYQLQKNEVPAGIIKFMKHYPETKEAYVVSINYSGKSVYDNKIIYFIKYTEIDFLELFRELD